MISEAEYNRQKPLYEELVTEIKFALEKELKGRNIKVADVSGRVKTYESLIEKVKAKNLKDPFMVDDVAGVRIMCLFQPDLRPIQTVIERLFDIRELRDKIGTLGLDRMGYQAHHYVVLLSPNLQGPRYDSLRELRCETQARTILQDAWAQISHHLVYKSETSIPKQLRRQVNNMASLLEIAQTIFDDIQEMRESYVNMIEEKQADRPEFLAQPINSDTLSSYTRWKYPKLEVSDYIQELLIRDLDHSKFRTLGDIDAVVNSARELVEAYRSESPELFRYGTDYITKSLDFKDEPFRKTHPFGTATRAKFSKYPVS